MSDRPFVLQQNNNVPHIHQPVADLGSLLTAANSLKQGVESLGGHRGLMQGRAVTFDDLVGLGLLTPITGNTTTGSVVSGVATKDDLAKLVVPVLAHASLPAAPVLGQEAVVIDATVNTWGASVTGGGGGFTVRVWYNGANWTVTGV